MVDQIPARLTAIRARILEEKGDAALIVSPENRRYLSGFCGSSGVLLITRDTAQLITDFRYALQVRREAPHYTLRLMSTEAALHTMVVELLAELGIQQLLIEAQHTTVAFYQALLEAIREHETVNTTDHPPELVPVNNLVEPLREVKAESELTLLRQAVAITDAAMASVLPQIRPEHTERHVAWMLEQAIRERGAERIGFPIIVAAGPNAALPHATPTDEPIGEGRPIIIDMGAVWQGYHADLTRTVTIGEADHRFWEIYQLVLKAQQAAIDGIRVGMTGEEADALARAPIAAAGFEEHFGHGLGHGVGLAIHEGPRLRKHSTQILSAGMVFSVEPGIYLEGWGGVRIEDLVLLGADGCTLLSQSEKQPVVPVVR